MRILSKWKDYYDYLSGIYGVDEKIILDRRTATTFGYSPSDNTKIILFVCGQIVEGWFKGGKYYWGEALHQIASWHEKDQVFIVPEERNIHYAWLQERRIVQPTLIPDKFKINAQAGCPIIMGVHSHKDLSHQHALYPKLQDFGINKIIPAKDIYLMITEYLSPKDPMSAPQSDKEKIISNGFDTKTSFRGKNQKQ